MRCWEVEDNEIREVDDIDYNTTADKFWKSSRLKVGSVVQSSKMLSAASERSGEGSCLSHPQESEEVGR